MFRVKICGITNVADARLAAAAGADAIGLNFYEPSPRFVPAGAAREIAGRIEGVLKVGVFVNPSAADAARVSKRMAVSMRLSCRASRPN